MPASFNKSSGSSERSLKSGLKGRVIVGKARTFFVFGERFHRRVNRTFI